MGGDLEHPERVVGMHFFNPVAVLPLVELVRAPATDDATLATAWDVTKKLGKRGVLVKDAPAFVVNRLLDPPVDRSSCRRSRTATRSRRRTRRRCASGIPMPPSALLALVGPRVANHVLHTLHDAFPDRFPLSPTLENFADGEMEVVVDGDAPRTVDEIHDGGARGARRRVPGTSSTRASSRAPPRSTPA